MMPSALRCLDGYAMKSLQGLLRKLLACIVIGASLSALADGGRPTTYWKLADGYAPPNSPPFIIGNDLCAMAERSIQHIVAANPPYHWNNNTPPFTVRYNFPTDGTEPSSTCNIPSSPPESVDMYGQIYYLTNLYGWAMWSADYHTWEYDGYFPTQFIKETCPDDTVFLTDAEAAPNAAGCKVRTFVNRANKVVCLACQKNGKMPPNPGFGDPIYPLFGVTRQSVDMGLSLGNLPWRLTYENTPIVTPPTAPGFPNAIAGGPAFGDLWVSNLHRRLLISPGTHNVLAYRGDGAVIAFNRSGSNYSTDPDLDFSLQTSGGNYILIDRQGKTIELYNSSGYLVNWNDLNAGSVHFAYSDANTPPSVAPAPGYLISVTDNWERTVLFTYPGGKMATVTYPDGRVTNFSYDAGGNLVRITWPDGNYRQFTYQSAAARAPLTGVIDENGSQIASFGYDSSGRAVSTELAGGKGKYSVTWGAAPAVLETEYYDSNKDVVVVLRSWQAPSAPNVTGPNGQSISLSADPGIGAPLATSVSQPAGSGSSGASSNSAYDGNGNAVYSDDYSGQRTCFAYDSLNREISRVEGLSTSATCSAVLPINASLPSGARRLDTTWNSIWKLPELVSEPGKLTFIQYNGSGVSCSVEPLFTGAPVPFVCSQSVMATVASTSGGGGNGSDPYLPSVTLLLKGEGSSGSNVIFDSASAFRYLPASGTPAVSTVQKKFGIGSIFFDGSNGYVYDSSLTDFAFGTGDFTIEAWIYLPTTPGDSYVAIVDSRNSGSATGASLFVVSSNMALGWYTNEIRTPTNSLALNTWTHVAAVRAAGQLTLYINGVAKASGVDADDKYAAPTFIGRVYDNVHPPFSGYMDELRITKGVARYLQGFTPATQSFAGNDAVSPDVSVPVRLVSYTYDPGGRVLTMKDPNNKTTNYSYYGSTSFSGSDPNALGHSWGDLQSMTNPAGHVTLFTQYDKAGRVRQTVDPKGVTTDISYTPRGWVSSVVITPPGGAARTTSYVYDFVGQLIGVTNPDGTTLAYGYDAAHRLISITDGRGNSITYTLDNAGNRTGEQIKDSSGTLQRSVHRVFDALNRVQQVSGAFQ